MHVLLLEGCGARGVLAGGFVAGIAKRLLIERGLSRPPRLMDDEAGMGLLIVFADWLTVFLLVVTQAAQKGFAYRGVYRWAT